MISNRITRPNRISPPSKNTSTNSDVFSRDLRRMIWCLRLLTSPPRDSVGAKRRCAGGYRGGVRRLGPGPRDRGGRGRRLGRVGRWYRRRVGRRLGPAGIRHAGEPRRTHRGRIAGRQVRIGPRSCTGDADWRGRSVGRGGRRWRPRRLAADRRRPRAGPGRGGVHRGRHQGPGWRRPGCGQPGADLAGSTKEGGWRPRQRRFPCRLRSEAGASGSRCSRRRPAM